MIGRNLYKKYQAKCPDVEHKIEEDVNRVGANSRQSCLNGIISLFRSTEWREKDSQELYLLTSDHAKFGTACDLIRERAPGIQVNKLTSWSIIYVITLLCEDVWAIYDFIVHISRGEHLVPVLDMLYYLAAILLYLRRKHLIPSRLHYNLLHALNLHENMPNPSISVNAPTYEQQKVIEHELEPNQIVKIVGFAGTGKTITLAQYALERPNKHFLLIVFRKKQPHGQRFPPNVTIRTLHSLAFHAVGHKYSGRGKRGRFGALEIFNSHVLPERGPPNFRTDRKYQYRRAKIIDQTIKNFINSADPVITTEHIPKEEHGDLIVNEPIPSPAMPSLVPEEVIEDAELIWRIMKDPADHRFPLDHDGYLKEWQLSSPNLPFDNIMVDQAEHFSDAMMDIVLKQQCPRMIVGDPHQHIFPFRADHSPFDAMEATHTYYLTRCFHFGPAIAFVANSCLEALKGVKEHFLVGCEIRDSIVNHDEDLIVANPPQRTAVLARTRTQLCRDIIQTFCDEQGSLKPEKSNIKIGIIDERKFEKMLQHIDSIWALAQNNQPLYRGEFQFESFESLIDYIESVDEKKLSGVVSLIQWAQNRLPRCLDSIRQIMAPYKEADIVYGTVHEANSTTWETVVLLDDFPQTDIPHTPLTHLRGTSTTNKNKTYNVLYTAVTRATKKLVVNSALFLVHLAVQEKMERFVSTNDYIALYPDARCSKCNVPLPRNPPGNILLLETIPVRVCNNLVSGGALCLRCASQSFCMRPSHLSPVKGRTPEKPKTDFAHQTYAAWVGPLSEEERIMIDEANNVWKDFYCKISQS